jgi:hypothetical protein
MESVVVDTLFEELTIRVPFLPETVFHAINGVIANTSRTVRVVFAVFNSAGHFR